MKYIFVKCGCTNTYMITKCLTNKKYFRNVIVDQQKIAYLKNLVAYPQAEDPKNKENACLRPKSTWSDTVKSVERK